MRTIRLILCLMLMLSGQGGTLVADQAAKVTEAVNQVKHGSQESEITTPVHPGTLVNNGDYVQTESASRAELLLPSTSITRLGANTRFNYNVDSNTIDLEAGTILFCKPKESSRTLQVRTAAVTAGITGTTGFVSVQGNGKKAVYILGIIEGHAAAMAGGKPFLVGSGEIVEFRPGQQPFKFSFDIPRFVRSSSLLHKFKGALPNQAAIDRVVADYQDDLSRGFIIPPKSGIDYSGDIPVYSSAAYDSAQNSQGGNKPPPPPPPSSSPLRGNYSPNGKGP